MYNFPTFACSLSRFINVLKQQSLLFAHSGADEQAINTAAVANLIANIPYLGLYIQ